MEKKIYLTKKGHQSLKEQLDRLIKEERTAIAKLLKEARAHGDLRENAEYQTAKEAQSFVETRILRLQQTLKHAYTIEKNSWDGESGQLGTKVRLKDLMDNEEVCYTLLHQEEADPEKDYISIQSPVGQALLGKKAGEEVAISVPAGVMKYLVLEVGWFEGPKLED